MQASQHFGRPVGGRKVATEAIEYLRAQPGVTSLEVEAHVGGGCKGPESLIGTVPLEPTLSQLIRNRPAWRWRIDITATFANTPIEVVKVSVRRTWTGVHIAGDGPSAVAGERSEVLAVLAPSRRLAAGVIAMFMFVAALIGVVVAVGHH